MQEDVNTLHKNKLITSQATVKLSKLQNDINQASTISVFTKTSGTKDFKEPLQEFKSLQKKFSQINSDKETPLYIRKSTAVWLFQEGERVLSDRLFRVRVAQPFSSSTSKCESDSEVTDGEVPFVATQLKTGYLGVFKSIYYTSSSNNWNIGKVQSFYRLKGKKMKELKYKHFSVDFPMTDIDVLCTWFTECKSQFIFDSMSSVVTDITHSYIPISNYICTLTRNFFDIVSSGTEGTKSITTSVMHQQEILMAQKIKITEKC